MMGPGDVPDVVGLISSIDALPSSDPNDAGPPAVVVELAALLRMSLE
jgi:hypothetical protein